MSAALPRRRPQGFSCVICGEAAATCPHDVAVRLEAALRAGYMSRALLTDARNEIVDLRDQLEAARMLTGACLETLYEDDE